MLEHLADITVALAADNTGFSLAFHFNTNPYFTNQVVALSHLYLAIAWVPPGPHLAPPGPS